MLLTHHPIAECVHFNSYSSQLSFWCHVGRGPHNGGGHATGCLAGGRPDSCNSKVPYLCNHIIIQQYVSTGKKFTSHEMQLHFSKTTV